MPVTGIQGNGTPPANQIAQFRSDGITAATRTDGQYEYVFLLSFAREAHKIDLGKAEFQDLLTGEKVAGSIQLASYTSRILKRPIKA